MSSKKIKNFIIFKKISLIDKKEGKNEYYCY